jgi:hypothetical protein
VAVGHPPKEAHVSDEVSSPDGAFKVEFHSHEVRMSHWIDNPRVTIRDELLLDLWVPAASDWSAAATFDAPGTVTLHLRKYPGTAPGIDIRIDAESRTWKTLRGECPEEMKRWLRKHLREA